MTEIALKDRELAGRWDGMTGRLVELYKASQDEDFRHLTGWVIHEGNTWALKLGHFEIDRTKADARRWRGNTMIFIILGEYILRKET